MCRAFTLARLGLLLYPFAKLADVMNWCWWKIRTHGIKEDLERIQKELEKDEFSQSLCPICLEPLESQKVKQLLSILKFRPLCKTTEVYLWDLVGGFLACCCPHAKEFL